MNAPLRQSSKPLVVLQVIPALDAGGAERTTVDMARAVIAAGGRALIATEGGRLAKEAEAAGAVIKPGPYASKNPLTLLAEARRLAAIIRGEGVTLVHARSRAPAWSAYWATRNPRVPFVTTYHGIYSSSGPFKRFYNSVMTRADAVIANSHWTAAHLRALYPESAARLTVVPRGIDIGWFTPASVAPERVAAIRGAWQLPQGKRVILLPERLTSWKGHAVLLEALARLRTRDFIAVLAGDPQGRETYVAELKQTVERLGLADNVRIPGHCADMPAAYLAAEIVVAPSIRAEAFGRVAVEAQAMERLIIASALGAQTETLVDGVTGWHVPPGDAQALAARLDEALAMTPEQRHAIGAAGRKHVADIYSVERMCASTLAVYTKLLGFTPAA